MRDDLGNERRLGICNIRYAIYDIYETRILLTNHVQMGTKTDEKHNKNTLNDISNIGYTHWKRLHTLEEGHKSTEGLDTYIGNTVQKGIAGQYSLGVGKSKS
jgi:hypothetical protein